MISHLTSLSILKTVRTISSGITITRISKTIPSPMERPVVSFLKSKISLILHHIIVVVGLELVAGVHSKASKIALLSVAGLIAIRKNIVFGFVNAPKNARTAIVSQILVAAVSDVTVPVETCAEASLAASSSIS